MDISKFLFNSKNTIQLDFKRTEDVIGKFINKFIDDDLIEKRILLWSSIKSNITEKTYRISSHEIKNLPISNQEHVYMYIEREKKLFKTILFEVFDFIEQKEPWEEIDGIIFDETFKWFISLTHEDVAIVLGL